MNPYPDTEESDKPYDCARSYYLALRKVLAFGKDQYQRAKVDGDHISARVLHNVSMKFEGIHTDFPLVTTKYVNYDHVLAELLWFISGSTNIKPLKDQGCNIWNAWADENGDLGPIYGKQWRSWEGPQGKVDQLQNLIDVIKEVADDVTSPKGRRLLLLNINPADLPDESVPTGCHTMAQFHVEDGRYLSCSLYQRSGDMFLGVPYNIACYATLLRILARATRCFPTTLYHTIGNAHIYGNHRSLVDEQLAREPYDSPSLIIKGDIDDINKITKDQFELIGYNHHPALRGKVAV